ncbi:MAG: DUF6443 domain-containing protein [Lutibacter sp.]
MEKIDLKKIFLTLFLIFSTLITNAQTPAAPTIPTASGNCGSGEIILLRGTPSSGVTWYWQEYDFTRDTKNSGVTFIAPNYKNIYYLRAKDNDSNTWSDAVSVDYSSINPYSYSYPSRPYSSDIGKNNNSDGSVTLSRDNPPNGNTWYWQSSSDGTSLSNSNTSIRLTTGNIYYLRTRDNTTGCWSSGSASISYTVSIVNPPTIPIVTYECNGSFSGNATFTRGTPPIGITWYWQSSATGTSTSYSEETKTITYGSGTYYLRAREDSSRKWSEAVGVDYTTIGYKPGNPNSAYINKNNNSDGSITLTYNYSTSGITYYWQSSPSETSLTSPTSVTLYTGSIYYVRARNNITGCWSDNSASKDYTVSWVNPPTTPILTYECSGYYSGKATFTRGVPPAGETWYWQSSATGTSTSYSEETKTIPFGSGTYYLRARDNNYPYNWSEAVGVGYDSYIVTPTAPSTYYLSKTTNSDGSVTLTRTNPPSGETWYWQSSVNGTSINNSQVSFKVTSGSIYYLKARNNKSGCWSAAASISYNTSYAQTPEVPVVSYDCNVSSYSYIKPILTRGTPPSGTTWYWQSNATGTSKYSNDGITYQPNSGSIYYLRANKDGTSYWSEAVSVSYVSNQILPNTPSIYSLSKTTNSDGSVTLTRTNPPSGVTYYWQTTSDGESLDNSQVSFVVTSGTIYYIRSQNNLTGCWSAAASISYNTSYAQTPEVPVVSYDCNVSSYSYIKPILTRGTPPSGTTWYWQSNATGTSKYSNDGITYQPNSGSIYYLRANKDGTSYWSEAVSVSYVSNQILPNTPSIYSLSKTTNSDGSVTLTRTNPPSGVTYYWQTISDGENLDNSQVSFVVTTGSIYYLRPRNDNTKCWGDATSISYTATIVIDPDAPVVTPNCGSVILTKGTPPSGTSWYWQSFPTDKSTYTSNSSESITRTSGSTYYLRANADGTNYWSDAIAINYTIPTVVTPSIPSAPTITNNLGNTVLTRLTPETGVTWYWQSTSNGESKTDSNETITLTSGSTYYLRAFNNISGCWSSSRAVNYSVITTPTPSTPSVIYNCETSSNTVTLTRDIPPIGITWYWQISFEGTSTSNSNTTITLTSGNIYFLRAREDSTGKWSIAKEVTYNINVNPSTPTSPTITSNDGNAILTRSNPPTGTTWYWQSTVDGTSTADSNASVTLTSGSVYYLRGQDDVTSCWGNTRTINYVLKPEMPTIVQNCGNTVLTKTANIPDNVSWYWQSSITGKNTYGSSAEVSVTRVVDTTYYLRAQNNITGDWSDPLTVNYTINSVPDIPGVPTVTNNIGNTVLTMKGTVPSSDTWYWQSAIDGTITDVALSNTTITLTNGIVHYLRAQNNTTGCWSDVRVINYTVVPNVPDMPTILNNCGETVLMKGAPVNNEEVWYWQSSAQGTNTTNQNLSVSLTSGTQYFLRAFNSLSNLWSDAATVSYSVKSVPQMPNAPTISYSNGSTILSKVGSSATNVSWYWQSNGSNIDMSVLASDPTLTLASGTQYYLRAYNNISDCWSDARIIEYSVETDPLPPTIASVTNNCGSSTLVRNNPTKTNETWYWQSYPTGTSKTYTNETAIRTSTDSYYYGNTYYLRAYNLVLKKWSDATPVVYEIIEPPAIPTVASVTHSNGMATITRNNPPIGITWYWQTSHVGTSIANSNLSIIVTEGPIAYLRAYNATTDCWSKYLSINTYENEIPNPPTLTDITIINNCGNTELIKGSAPSGISFYWQTTLDGTLIQYTDINGLIVDNYLTSKVLTSGTKYYLRAVNVANMNWSTTSLEINYTIDNGPAIPDLPTITYNVGSTTLTKSGVIPVGVEWYWQSASSDINVNDSANTPKTLTSGTRYFLRALNTNSGCWGEAREIIYTITSADTPLPPEVTSSVTYNENDTAMPLTAIGTNLLWYATATGGVGTGAAPIPNTSAIGNTSYYVSQTVNELESNRAEIVVTVIATEIPLPPEVTSSVTYNVNDTAMPLTAIGSNLLWYTTATGGVGTGAAPIPNTSTIGNTSYYVSQTVNELESARAEIVVTVIAIGLPLPPEVTSSITYNENDTAIPLTAIGTNLLWYATATGGVGTGAAPIPNTSTIGNTSYYVSQTVNELESARAEIVVTVITTKTPLPPEVTSSITYNVNDTVIPLTAIGTNLLWYTTSFGGTGTSNAPTPNTAIAGSTSYFVSQTVNGIESARAEIVIMNIITTIPANYVAPILSDENYILTRVFQRETTTGTVTLNKDVIESITYFDGLGRPIQQIGIKQSPDNRDIITHIDYDFVGRQEKDYLPYVPTIEGSNGTFRADALSVTNSFYSTTKYENTANPYSQKLFEASPLNRVLQQAAPGANWALGSGHEIIFDYQTNTTATEVRLYEVVLDANYTPTVLDNNLTFYGIGELYKTITYDENYSSGLDHSTEEFKDKQGKVVLKRTYNASAPHDTYYVYDDYGDLTYVLPPKMEASTATIATINSQLNELGYQYKYDHRNRLVEKKTPGKGKEYIVYDILDRPVLTQDAIQAPKKEWLFTKYDVFGRVAYTGIYTHSSELTQLEMQSIYNANHTTEPSFYEEKVSSGTGFDITYYTNVDFPTSNIEILSINYYDDYAFDAIAKPNTNVYLNSITDRTKGLPTGSKVKVLDQTNKWITTTTYYDDKARPIYVNSHNEYLGTTDIIESKLDFVGKVDKTKATHIKELNNPIITEDTFEYDNAGRLLTQTQTIGGTNPEVIVANTYDELGQLTRKGVGGTPMQNRLQTVDYAYNIRGWLKTINNDADATDNDLFNFRIGYNEGVNPLYNGNISLTEWNTTSINNTTNPVSSMYHYTYDALNRITGAIDNTTNNNYALSLVDYDKNGNIQHLNRKGHTNQGATSFGEMDQLTYLYDSGNKLMQVTDAILGTAGDGGFKDGNKTGNDYTYDENGNLKIDKNKGIINISYNHLNLPSQVTFAADKYIDYIYDATGVKLEKVVTEGTNTTRTKYAGNYIYEEASGLEELKFFNQPEGYVEPDGSGGFDYVYQFKDHLGNIRLSYKDVSLTSTPQLEIVEENNYYPFGLQHKGYNNTINGVENNFKTFQGKEDEKELGRNTYDFGWRDYDPAIARWNVVDPLAEIRYELTPYNFVQNSPMFRIDPDGLTDYTLNKKTGEVEQVGDANDDPDRILKTYSSGKRKGEVKYNKKGEAKVAIGGIEQGILSDGQNFKTEGNAIEVGGEGQPTQDGVESFALKLSDYVGTEIGGAYFSKNGGESTTHITLGGYENNSFKETKSHGMGAFKQFASTVKEFTSSITGFFHTHPNGAGISDSDRLVPSLPDRQSRDNSLKVNPTLRFFLLTHPEYGGKFPRKIDYSKGYPASDRR